MQYVRPVPGDPRDEGASCLLDGADVLALASLVHLSVVARDARFRANPNAGWGESAMAHVLNVRLGGDPGQSAPLVKTPMRKRCAANG